jgi:hypothetical protein
MRGRGGAVVDKARLEEASAGQRKEGDGPWGEARDGKCGARRTGAIGARGWG